jgi:acetate kinase
MAGAILVLNAGSSSLKFSLFGVAGDELALEVRGRVEGLYTQARFVATDASGRSLAAREWDQGARLGHDGAVEHVRDFLGDALRGGRLIGVGHRVVHGGPAYAQPVRLDAGVLGALERLIPLAPLHQPHALAPVKALLARAPDLPQVACFDTAFHRTNPDVAQRFALPEGLHEAGVRRYGFHGLSFEYIASARPRVDAGAAAGRTIVLHLGNGSSLCALAAGRSVASTMGFTPVDGLPMGTRSGTLDPGVLLYLMDERQLDARGIERLIYHESGLLGVSGLSSDMRTLLESPDPRARVAVDLFVYRVRREVGSLAGALRGLDALVFTAGIGENSATIRERVCLDASWLGLTLDAAANRAGGPRLSATDSRVRAWMIPTDEELMIARHVRRLVLGR